MGKYAQGKFQVQNAEKYIGKGAPTYRSSWEFAFMQFCDNNPAVVQWASEAIHVNYRNPFTGKNTIYVPDFLIIYIDKNGKRHGEVIEVKPTKESTMEAAKTLRDKAAVALNMFKWEAARKFCAAQGLKFRVVNEQDIFHGAKKR
tara:strand:+ start:9755 stop:10189 length:435 start_codon:yes stop_codon:yes gene_type:complete